MSKNSRWCSRKVLNLGVEWPGFCWDGLGKRSNHLFLVDDNSLLLFCLLCAYHLIQRSNVVQKTKTGKNPKNLTRRTDVSY